MKLRHKEFLRGLSMKRSLVNKNWRKSRRRHSQQYLLFMLEQHFNNNRYQSSSQPSPSTNTILMEGYLQELHSNQFIKIPPSSIQTIKFNLKGQCKLFIKTPYPYRSSPILIYLKDPEALILSRSHLTNILKLIKLKIFP